MTSRIRVGLFLLMTLLLYGWLAPVRIVRVAGRSMEPSFRDGQFLIASTDTRYLLPDDVVVVRRGPMRLVKRVAYVGGDRIFQVRNDGVWCPTRPVGGEARARAFWHRVRRATRWFTVPQNEVYVLGDNTVNSVDSRDFGPVPRAQVEAVVVTR